ncbi:MAG: flagellar biosynthetic protein FliO [Burkholderiaceae bacterium]|nr:flagellar biosynthetic protein FliO [Burkholderiaceae bacterium]
MNRTPLRLAFLFFFSSAANAAESAAPTSSGGLFQVLLGLILVLGLMAGAAWLLKRFAAPQMSSGAVIKIIGGIAVGNRERIMVIEVADQWIVVGIAPGQVNTLSTMPKQELPQASENAISVPSHFSGWLQQIMDKRNGK